MIFIVPRFPIERIKTDIVIFISKIHSQFIRTVGSLLRFVVIIESHLAVQRQIRIALHLGNRTGLAALRLVSGIVPGRNYLVEVTASRGQFLSSAQDIG